MTSPSERGSPEPETSIPLHILSQTSNTNDAPGSESAVFETNRNSLEYMALSDWDPCAMLALPSVHLDSQKKSNDSPRSGSTEEAHEISLNMNERLPRVFKECVEIPEPELLINEGLEERWNVLKESLTREWEASNNADVSGTSPIEDPSHLSEETSAETGVEEEDSTLAQLIASESQVLTDEGILAIEESDDFVKRIFKGMICYVAIATPKKAEFDLACSLKDVKALKELGDGFTSSSEEHPIAKAWKDHIIHLQKRMAISRADENTHKVYVALMDFFQDELADIVQCGKLTIKFETELKMRCRYLIKEIRAEKWLQLLRFMIAAVVPCVCLMPLKMGFFSIFAGALALTLTFLGLVFSVCSLIARL